MKDNTVNERRRRNLIVLVERYGGPTSLARRLGLSGPSYISQLVGRGHRRQVTEKVARSMEEKLGLDTGWLDKDHATAPHMGAKHPSVAQAVRLVSGTAQAQGIDLSPSKLSELVALVYDRAVEDGKLDEDLTCRILSLLKPE